jgi:hypothetical protein
VRTPVTVASQGLFVGPDDADELVDLLLDAAAVIGCLAGHPAAEAALAGDGNGPQQDCTDLAIDLRLAAGRLDEETTGRRIRDHIAKHGRKAGEAFRKAQQHARENQHSEEWF